MMYFKIKFFKRKDDGEQELVKIFPFCRDSWNDVITSANFCAEIGNFDSYCIDGFELGIYKGSYEKVLNPKPRIFTEIM